MYFLTQLRVVFLDHVRTCTYVFLNTVTCRVSGSREDLYYVFLNTVTCRVSGSREDLYVCIS